ncbi:hypothetical protein C8A00DRAFT_43330 [Chaetomidium leptoderma]|uniref:ubiquitinyl hydrolase 1 n=1 Tax=Chaetomidium leptoderma TaxID=669021 RepID=A0AAN6ZVT3_9PEZI|nr:hypothetical protein C8A00DRAFT_43330 [Chaetomidium leptoderma]
MEKSLFHHFALPQRLPHSEDANLDDVEGRLTAYLVMAVRLMRESAAGDELRSESSSVWERLQQCLVVSKAVTRDGRVDRMRLLSELRRMTALDAILVYIRSQNAALLIHRLSDSAEEVVFEVFEASPRNEDCLAADNALQWDFPGSAVAIPLATFDDDNFRVGLADFLELASLESTKAFGAQSFKAGVESHENRDTANPAIISSLLMAVIEENGRRLSTPLLRKHVRDDVCWSEARRPWRRSPYWLVLRVAISRYLLLALGPELGRFEYKFCLCVCLSKFLKEAEPSLEVDQVHFLKAKLCRRLAKLDVERDSVQDQHLLQKVDRLFSRLTPIIDPTIQNAVHRVQSEWKAWKESSTKGIPPLPRRASPSDTKLSLRISGRWLQEILASSKGMMDGRQRKWIPPPNFDPSSLTNEHFAKFAEPLLQIAEQEDEIQKSLQSFGVSESDTPRQMQRLIEMGLPLYRGNPGQMSLLILDVMELWMRLDAWTCQKFPLLQQYHPVFTPEIMDVLHLALYKDMVRLQDIQRYLEARIEACRGSKITVFDDPTNDCFARRYYDEGPSTGNLAALRENIEETASNRKQAKLDEWRRKSAQYDDLTRQINGSACILTVDDDDPHGRGEHIERFCPRCQAIRRLARLRIEIHEHPLPSDDFMVKVVVFELLCPRVIAVYRDTTWLVLSRLASSAPAPGVQPKCLLRGYSALAKFDTSTKPPSFALASLTKSFLETHYATVPLPVEWEGGRAAVCKPNGLKLAYFDERSGIWTGRTRLRPQFAHHVQLQLPQNSPFRALLSHRRFAAEGDGPSSYEIMATQMSCPSGLNPHEFLAFKTLMSGTAQRWISILVELGAANLNWSNEASKMLLTHLALQCGPASEQNDNLRLIHSVFRDAHFVEKLLDQVNSRLSDLATLASWREEYLMGTIITLALRILDLAAAAKLGTEIHDKALGCVLQAREVCVRWSRLIREEILTSPDTAAAQQLQQRALASALLCRRTFVIHLEHSVPFDSASLATYVESAIVTQENMVRNIDSLPQTMLQDMVSAIKLSYRLKRLVSRSVCESPDGLRDALKQFWPDADRIGSANSEITLDRAGWVSCDIAETETESHQVVSLDLLFGTLLVNGKPVGKLPQDSQNSLVIKELFGDQPLRVFESSVPGMTYALTNRPHGFTVHIGYEDRDTIIVAKSGGPLLRTVRFISREMFYNGNTSDLPGPLIGGRIHWLDLNTGDIYITPLASPWDMMNPSRTWTMNIHKRDCWKLRFDGQSYETAVDPHSPVFKRIAKIMDGLANRRDLLVTQPSRPTAGLEVQIPHLHLMFFVSPSKRLFSPQLGLEIDPNQDAGTWYGLASKLVCCSADNPLRRTVLVPLGDLSTARSGCHVTVNIARNGGMYGKFTINDTLGRIDCAPEPALVYTKALLHAYTSFLVPDPLTGRTGAEESLDWLQSGICRPWTVLRHMHAPVLPQIASLTPMREYYPPDLKVMKTDRWNEHVTCHMQHPLYRQVIEEIMTVSKELETFATTQGPILGVYDLPPAGEACLTARALARRRLYERKGASEDDKSTSNATHHLYVSRDTSSPSEARYASVMEITHLLRTKPERFKTPANLATILSQRNTIGGYGAEYDTVSLTDRMRADIRENWGSLVESCRRSQSSYSLMFLFAALTFRQNFDDGLLKGLLAFAIFSELQSISLPPWPSYFNFRPDSNPGVDDIAKLIHPFRTPAPEDDGEALGMLLTAKQRRKIKAAKDAHEMRSDDDCRYLARFLLAQWPCKEPDLSKLPRVDLLVDIGAALEVIRPEWVRLYHNRDLSVHLNQVQLILDRHRSDLAYPPPKEIASEGVFGSPGPLLGGVIPRLHSDLLAKPFDPSFLITTTQHSSVEWTPLASSPQDGRQSFVRMPNQNAIASNAKPRMSPQEARRHIDELQTIIDDLANSKSLVRKTYAQDLLQSLEAFKNLRIPQHLATFLSLRDNAVATSEFIRAFTELKASLERQTSSMSSRRIRWLQLGGLWPAITTVSLLEQLRSTANPCFGSGMRDALITFGLTVTQLQRGMRLNDYVLAGDTSRFADEEANFGHTNWKPQNHPDWLLLEIDSNLLIRPDQVDVALATISPASGTNSVLQMNMGQGKTSCIIPMVAAAMADKKSLVRIIVPKALLLQTAQLLQSRLGRFLNRHVGHIPFSRRTAAKGDSIRLYHNIHKRTLKAAGVMLCLPEHNLSFLLSGQQRILDNKVDEARPMVRVHSWLRSVCRDILDESDYTLAARTQLIYPSGPQMSVDGHPLRWRVIQALLSLVDQHLYGLQSSFPQSIEVVRRRGGGFPLIYFVRRDVENELLKRLAADITKGHGGILPMSTFDGTHKLKPTTLERMRNLRPDRPQYGLRPNSDPVAVPYHAKGVPSEQSEWGHPDVAILFTCLVFYYDGIDEGQLRLALTRVLKSDDPSTEYDKWVQSSDDFPASVRAWNTINVEDDAQVREIWKAVRYRVVVIDYFLNNFVFPQHAKQFKVKLQSSGWDIPLFSAQSASPSVGINGSAENQLSTKKARLRPRTTGFSGTNDNRTMLPLTIQQADLTTLSHTNAEVLTYLLHDRSRRCEIITNPQGGRATERDLLVMLRRQNIRILIDAGAQILEMDNETLAREWLHIDERCDAALYFDSDNKPWVISKLGRRTPLLASPYADDLTKCLVYLDEAHTRGTDLKFPLDARGALTVGQGQSKDHTVQAAMRLRQLGTSQSITFFIPPEVRQVIADLRKKKSKHNGMIDSHDIICWLLDNSCDSIEQLQPLYYSQGIDFCRRTQAALDNPDYLTNPGHRAQYVASIRQNELQTLQEMYEPKTKGTKHGNFQSSHPKVAAFAEELNLRRRGFQDTGRAVHGSALQEVEQEREVAFEVESVRQVKKPVQYDTLSFPGLHQDIEVFVRTGRLPIDSHAVSHIFQLLSTTALGRKHKVSCKGSHAQSRLFVSREFNRTVKLYTCSAPDNLLRPVNWVLWSELVKTAIVLIPEEAEQVMRRMHAQSTHPKVHLMTYASPVTKRMMAFNNLTFFSMPPLPEDWVAPQWLKTELGLLAGRLYFEWPEYETLCKFLGVPDEKDQPGSVPLDGEDEEEEDSILASEDDGEKEDGDGDGDEAGKKTIIAPRKKGQTVTTSFSLRPLTFLQEWLAIRRHGQDFVHTPMGFLTQGKPLQASHPFFGGDISTTARTVVGAGLAGTTVGGSGGGSRWGGDDNGHVDEGAVFDGVDDMGANMGDVEGDDEGEKVVYDDSEWFDSDVSESETDDSDY